MNKAFNSKIHIILTILIGINASMIQKSPLNLSTERAPKLTHKDSNLE